MDLQPISTAHDPGFGDQALRSRLTPPAVNLACDIADAWQLTNHEAAALLGVSPGTWRRIRDRRHRHDLNQDQMARVSLLGGIWQKLDTLFGAAMAGRWPRMPRTGRLFGGLTPIALMIAEGIPIILVVRQHLVALQTDLARGSREGAQRSHDPSAGSLQ